MMGQGNGFDPPELVPANSAWGRVFAPDGERADCAPGLADLTLSQASCSPKLWFNQTRCDPSACSRGGIRRPC